MRRRFALTCTLLILFTACGKATAIPTQTPAPTRTQVPTETLQPTVLPSETPTSSPISSPTVQLSDTPADTATVEPTLTQTAEPDSTATQPPMLTATNLPQPAVDSAAIQFYGPGPLSKAVSPMVVYGYAIPGYGALGKVFLYGEDGRLMASKLLQLNTAFTWAYFYGTLTFEVQGAGELGRLTMTTQDQYGRYTAENSVHLILLPEGMSIINAPGNVKERCVIEKPMAGRRNSGGIVTIAGEMRPYNNLPLEVELTGRDGKVIATQATAISPAADDSYVPFQVDVHYSIPYGTYALVSVSQPDDRIAGTMYLYSREIYLYP
jgi:hypothetical protein